MDDLIDIRRLFYFVAVAEELHFTRAAGRLHIAQPPLSYQIQQLEKDLGVQLFERNRHQVQLTEAGKVLLDEARRIFAQLEQTVRQVRRVGHGEVGFLTLGFVPSASNSVLPTILQAFQQQFPAIQLFLKEMNPDQMVQALHDHRIDVGMVYMPLADSVLCAQTVLREPFVVALPVSHPQAREEPADLHTLAAEYFIVPSRYAAMPGLYAHVMEACHQAGFTPKVRQEAWLMQTIIGLVAANMGIALVPASIQNLHRTGVIYRPLRDITREVELGVVWRRDSTFPVLQRFLQVISTLTSDAGSAGLVKSIGYTDLV
jgi:DNA-binding transcriptional LysR family regulator